MTLATHEIDELSAEELDSGGTPERRLGYVVAGTYRITKHIGSGGSSHVFEAEHLRLGRPFAVKLLRAEIDGSRRTAQRFRREARAIARLHSEHVVSVIDCGALEDQTPYLVMELLEGEDLRSLLRREAPLPIRRAVPLLIQACRGVSAVHAAGLIHRDVKPENLFVARRSTGEDWCKVLDLGVAKMEASLATTPGVIVGTVRYMAPEQLSNGAPIGPSTDVYALGAILYECLTGRPLHEGSTVQQVMYSVMNGDPSALHELRPRLPQALVEAISRAVRKDSSDRPATPEAFSELLTAAAPNNVPQAQASAITCAEEDAVPPVPSVIGRPTSRARSTLVWVASSALLAGALGWLLGGRTVAPSPREPQPARTVARLEAPPAQSPVPAVVAPANASTPVPVTSVASPSAPARAVPAVRSIQAPPAASSGRKPSVVTGVAVGNLDAANPYGE